MRAEVRKSIEFSLPQAQGFYISSRNKFILVKTTNLSLSPFMPSCTPISSATIIPISSWSGLTTKTTTPGPNFHMATRHVEDGSKLCWRAFWRSLRWQNTLNLKQIVNKKKMRIFNDEIDEISSGEDKFPNISSVTSKMRSQLGRACVARWRSNFWLAHRTMLKLGSEV